VINYVCFIVSSKFKSVLAESCYITALHPYVVSSRFLDHLLLMDTVDMAVVDLELDWPEVDMLGLDALGLDVVGNTLAVLLVVQDNAVVVAAGMKRPQLL